MSKKLFLPLSILLLLWQSGCASITDSHQYVRIATDSSQSEIYYDGKQVGVGSQTIKMSRGISPKIEIENEWGEKEEIKLNTSYRWGQSFGGNALLFTYAPIGWALDLLSGSAWDIKRPLPSEKNNFNIDDNSRILILPPQSENSFQSFQRGQDIEDWLKKEYPKTEVLAFVRYFRKSVGHGFDYESIDEQEDINDFSELLYETKATHLVFSKVNQSTQKIELNILSPYSEKSIAKHSISKVNEDEKVSTTKWLITETFSLLPNTLSVGSVDTNYSTCSYRDGFDPTYCAGSENRNSFSFLSSLNLTNVLHYRKRKPWHFYTRFYPDFTLSLNNITFEKSLTTLPDIDLDWYYLSFGYGIRFSFVIPVGEMFLEMNPFWAMNYLRLYSNNTESTHWIGKIGIATQFGFNTWLSNQWNVRLFGKIQQQSIAVPGISTIDPGSEFSGNLFTFQTGISLGYYFLEEKVKLFDSLMN